MGYRSVIILAIIINVSHKTDAYLKGIPRDTEVKVNDSTYMNCSTSLLANQVQWRHGKYYVYTGIAILEPYNDGRFKVEVNTSTGASNLIIRSVQPSDAGRYECLEDEGFGEQSSAQLIVLDVFSSEVTINLTMNDEVSCFANTSQSCSYKWKWFSGDDISTESVNQTLKPIKVGMHRCEAICSIRDKPCTVQSMYAKVYSAAATNGENRMSLLALLLVPALAVICVIVFVSRKRKNLDESLAAVAKKKRQLEREQQRLLGLIATIRTKAAEEEKKKIRGLTILGKKLLVVSKESSEVEVYDSMNFSFSRRWKLKELINPVDIVSCDRNKCLYISDEKRGSWLREILRVDPNGKLIKKWSTKNDSGRLSVTYESNVFLIVFYENKLNEYSPDGQLIREIILSSDEGFRYPRHAIKLTNGQFVVSHGYADDDYLHRVCIVDADGKLLTSFGGKRGSTIGQTDRPICLSVDGNDFVLVADFNNSRVLLLDYDLKFKRVILSEEHGLRYPSRILLDESSGRLFVADNESNNQRILIFKL